MYQGMVTVYLMLCLVSLQVVLNNSDVRAAIVNHMPNIEGHLARGWFPRIYQTEGNILLEKLLIRHCHVAIST